MCGILGVVGKACDETFRTALSCMSHRGPDDVDTFREPGIQLGHRRLSIIDLSRDARQPMFGVDGLVGLLNGEIYNYAELRVELETAGYSFKTASDTEVMLNAFHYWREGALARFVGMFALAIYDRTSRLTFLARDPLGVKPLYFARNASAVCFSSEVKSLLVLDPSKRSLNLAAVSSYFSFRYPVLSDSFFLGVEQIPPGCSMTIDEKGGMVLRKYWGFAERLAEQDDDCGEAWYIAKLNELLTSSVRYQMNADVPVGAYLSGGIDSSAVVAHMALTAAQPIKTFTIGFREQGYNEFEYARLVADRYQTDHQEIPMTSAEYMAAIRHLITVKGAPLGVPNEVPLYLMSKELRKKVTVVLSGEGADEIFGGYGRIFRAADDYPRLLAHRRGNGDPALAEKLEVKYGNAQFRDEVDHFLWHYRYMAPGQKDQILHSDVVALRIDDVLEARFRDVFAEVTSASYVNKMMYTFERLHLPGLLQRLDAATMAASVEGRVPFVDHRLVEFAFTVPPHYKLRWKPGGQDESRSLLADEISENLDSPKYILKEAVRPLLPNPVVDRTKAGFPVPLQYWLESAEWSLLEEQAMSAGEAGSVLEKQGVRSLIDQAHRTPKHANAMNVWMVANFVMFCQEYGV